VPSNRSLNKEVGRIIEVIERTAWEKCVQIEKGFKALSFMAGIYALKSEDGNIHYVGKANAFRTRFQAGHQILVEMFLDGFSPESVRIVAVPTTAHYADDLLRLEAGVIFLLRPQYNKRIPSFNEVHGTMQLRQPTTGHLKDILRYLPEPVVQAVEDHADTYGLTEQQVMEFAVANLLGLETTSLGDFNSEDIQSLAELREEVAILKARLKAAGLES
jgi:hypothetical protein